MKCSYCNGTGERPEPAPEGPMVARFWQSGIIIECMKVEEDVVAQWTAYGIPYWVRVGIEGGPIQLAIQTAHAKAVEQIHSL